MGAGAILNSRGGWARVVGWGAFLACSWTWCIGMFLPVLLVRDYGVWGFVVFAIPNCLGAAASGVAMRDLETRAWFLRTHAPAATAFSLVTVAFQAFFAAWIFPLAGSVTGAIVVVGALACLLGIAGQSALPRRLAATIAASLVTLVALVAAARSGEYSIPRFVQAPTPGLVAIAATCAFGFALCPYLDLTFWRARAGLRGSGGSGAFLVGFLVFFPLAIVLTLMYAGRFGDAEEFSALRFDQGLVTAFILAHIFIQLWVTGLFHAMEAPASGPGRASMAAACVCGIGLGIAGRALPAYHTLPFSELIYRVFMGAYGLVFPAYVWLCVVPTWRARTRLTARSVLVWAVSCVIAAPMFWLGFVERRESWLLPGLAIVVLARLLAPRGAVRPGRDSGEPPEPSGARVPVPTGPPTLGGHALPDRDEPGSPDRP